MSQTDWQPLTGSLADTVVRRGATAAIEAPSGGGSYTFGMRSVSAGPGVLAMYCLQTNFSPTPTDKGGRISGAIRRASLGASNGFSPFLFFAADDSDVAANAYLLGLSDESASHIQLRKGSIALGLAGVTLVDPDAAPNVLMQSSNTFAPDIWMHLRLDVIVQGSGDVILQVFRNQLTHAVTNPVWEEIPGMEGPSAVFDGYPDDSLGINTGSTPLRSGFIGFGTRFDEANRAAFFDHIAVDRQL